LGLDVKQAKPVRLSPKEREAVIDALNRILAGEFDGDIPLRFYESALAKVAAA
jgi:fumarate hydratase class II